MNVITYPLLGLKLIHVSKRGPGDMPHCEYFFIQLIEISFLLSKLLNDSSRHFKASFHWPFLGPHFLLTPWACVHVVTLQHVLHCHLIQGLLWVKRHTKPLTQWFLETDINGLVQERRNPIANALELRLSCNNPLIWAWVKWAIIGSDNGLS